MGQEEEPFSVVDKKKNKLSQEQHRSKNRMTWKRTSRRHRSRAHPHHRN
jgi:hypothetical protein